KWPSFQPLHRRDLAGPEDEHPAYDLELGRRELGVDLQVHSRLKVLDLGFEMSHSLIEPRSELLDVLVKSAFHVLEVRLMSGQVHFGVNDFALVAGMDLHGAADRRDQSASLDVGEFSQFQGIKNFRRGIHDSNLNQSK